MATRNGAIDRGVLLRLAADAQLDPRTVKKALELGLDHMKSDYDRVRLREAAAKHGVKLK